MTVAPQITLSPRSPWQPSARAGRAWLFILVGLVMLMVAVGGATRLTGSGLSITEWKPVTGALPPLSQADWLAEFEKYRQIPQYQLLNQGMSLAEFKSIYVWEWGHRQLGRIIGLVFFLPLAFFWIAGAVKSRTGFFILGIGALGGLQAAVGWIMVASGLKPGMVAVEPVKLMFHLVLASIILILLVFAAAGLKPRNPDRETPREARFASGFILALTLLQIALGGLVAGSKAGLVNNTWPLIDGRFIPPLSDLFIVKPWIENFFDNVLMVQFNHRMIAYLLVVCILGHAWRMHRLAPLASAYRRAKALAWLALAQTVLGITTLVLSVPLWAGMAHQLLAMLLLCMATVHARLSRDETRMDILRGQSLNLARPAT